MQSREGETTKKQDSAMVVAFEGIFAKLALLCARDVAVSDTQQTFAGSRETTPGSSSWRRRLPGSGLSGGTVQ